MGRYGPGRCPSCGGIPADGKVSCQKCLSRRTMSRSNKKSGICIHCQNKTAPNSSRCKDCLAKNAKQCKRWRQNNILNGLCSCGAEPKLGCNSCQACIDAAVRRNRNTMIRLRQTVFTHYGVSCVCCNISTIEFLSLDHIDGNGARHRKIVGHGKTFYRWAVKNLPIDLQVLCFNCNCAKSTDLCCPHKQQNTILTYQQRYRLKLRLEVFSNYGGVCSCCGETNEPFLTIDHISNDGAAHRRSINQTSNLTTYRWLIANNYPQIVQVLCWNCNLAKQIYGACPHQLKMGQAYAG